MHSQRWLQRRAGGWRPSPWRSCLPHRLGAGGSYRERLGSSMRQSGPGLSIAALKDAKTENGTRTGANKTSGKHYIHLWADGIYFGCRLTDDRPRNECSTGSPGGRSAQRESDGSRPPETGKSMTLCHRILSDSSSCWRFTAPPIRVAFIAMPRPQPKLHEAMQTILMAQSNRTASIRFIAEENARRDLYRQARGDGVHPSANQISARVRRYRDRLDSVGRGVVQYIGPDHDAASQ